MPTSVVAFAGHMIDVPGRRAALSGSAWFRPSRRRSRVLRRPRRRVLFASAPTAPTCSPSTPHGGMAPRSGWSCRSSRTPSSRSSVLPGGAGWPPRFDAALQRATSVESSRGRRWRSAWRRTVRRRGVARRAARRGRAAALQVRPCCCASRRRRRPAAVGGTRGLPGAGGPGRPGCARRSTCARCGAAGESEAAASPRVCPVDSAAPPRRRARVNGARRPSAPGPARSRIRAAAACASSRLAYGPACTR